MDQSKSLCGELVEQTENPLMQGNTKHTSDFHQSVAKCITLMHDLIVKIYINQRFEKAP
ncbi:hypothetical Protein YC6258_05433 [Gynuella sunshinyii YC6258]|uniref:Uncharacterized protein n=2 Tax=Gynuella sunshinyii TaxID=1445505 RepID=A0A0C5VVW8_9GAMM|nr:hypothetical Protein YC6258_05433 [Gynuella sunshinyii YC6258]